MDTNNWRPNQGAEPNMDNSDWRGKLQQESRQRIVNKIMDTLKRHLPGQEGLHELRKIAQRFEEKIFTAATSQSDYLRKISLKILTMETKSQGTMANNITSNLVGPSNKPPDPGNTRKRGLNCVDKAVKKQLVRNGTDSIEVNEEWIMGNKQYSWKSNIPNANIKARNVVRFPRMISKLCLRANQKVIKIVDLDVNKTFKCDIHTARRKNKPSTYEKYIAQGWYEFAKSKNFCDGDTLVWSMGRFSPYVYVKLQRN